MADNAERPERSSNDRGVVIDPNATGAAVPLPAEAPALPPRETHERQAAWLRGHACDTATDVIFAPPDELVALRAHRLFDVLADKIRDCAIFLIDVNGIIRCWGEGARLMHWWTTRQAEGAHLRLLYPERGAEDGTAEKHLQAAADTGEYSGEGRRVRNDGSTFWASVALTALRDDHDTLIGFANVTRDLSARLAREAVLKAHGAAEARSMAEEAQRLRDIFVASVSHEIRTPLHALLGYLALLDRESGGRERQRAHIARIRTSAVHLMEVVDDLLDMSRLEAGRFPVTVAVARIGATIQEALADIEPQATFRHVAIVNSVTGSAAEMSYWGDEARVRQILSNLLSNAVKFTARGGRVTISAGCAQSASPELATRAGPWVYVRVEDTGKGIHQDRLERIFEPFVQANAGDAQRGTGLGLSISRRLARLMGGDLSVHSEVGVGSTFVLWLPVPSAHPHNAHNRE